MKIITLHTNEEVLLKKALKQDRRAQKALFDRYAPKMLSACRYYIHDKDQAEEIMLGGFLKVFQQLSTYKSEGSFEGWIRKIMIRESISFLRKKSPLVLKEDMTFYEEASEEEPVELGISVKEIQPYIDALPEGARMVFNLYAIEGYTHKEIASILDITIGTSKTQFFRARKNIRNRITQFKAKTNGKR